MRGKDCRCFRSSLVGRITPAYAGKSRKPDSRLASFRDHPRVCGEKGRAGGKASANTGSPPRMRGKVALYFVLLQFLRITPAYAGKSLDPLQTFRASQDHPRVCGEKVINIPSGSSDTGSPPRMRGKALSALRLPFQRRITPAYAGKSCSARRIQLCR